MTALSVPRRVRDRGRTDQRVSAVTALGITETSGLPWALPSCLGGIVLRPISSAGRVAHRDLVRRRGPHRSEERRDAAMGATRNPAKTRRPALRKRLSVSRGLPGQWQGHRSRRKADGFGRRRWFARAGIVRRRRGRAGWTARHWAIGNESHTSGPYD